MDKIKKIKALMNKHDENMTKIEENIVRTKKMSEEKSQKRLTMKDFKALMDEQEKRRSEQWENSQSMTLADFLKKTAPTESSEDKKESKTFTQTVPQPPNDPILEKSPEALNYMSSDDDHADLNSKAIDQAVLKSTLIHPATLVPLALGSVAAVSCAIWAFTAIPAVVLIGVGLVSWNVNFFKRKQAFAANYVKKIQQNIVNSRRETMMQLDTKLKTNASLGVSNTDAVRAVRQLVAIQKKYNGFLEVLDSKLNKNEVTYSRYQGAAEQTNLAVINNLNTIVSLYDSLKTIDKNYLETRLKELSSQNEKDENDEQEIEELNKRLKMYTDHLRKIDNLLNENERAFTAMDKASLSLGRIQTTKTKGEQNLEDALNELEHLSENAEKYQVK